MIGQDYNMPKVSIILPVYNSGKYLSQAIESVFDQSYKDFELLIINDGSLDNTEEIIKKYLIQDQRIIYIKNSENKGLVYSLNLGLEKSTGQYIARLDSDDWWNDKQKLAKQVEFLETHPEVGLVGTFAEVFDLRGKKLYDLKYPINDLGVRERILIKNCFVHSSVVFRRFLAISNGQYLNEEKLVEDYGLWLRLGRQAKFFNLPECMVGYRLNIDGETVKNNLLQIKNGLEVIKRSKKYYPNYFYGSLKWRIKYILVLIFGIKFFGKIKLIFKK